MNIVIRNYNFWGGKTEIICDPNETISDLKTKIEKIQKNEGKFIDEFVLMLENYNKDYLQDDKTLSDYYISNNSQIWVCTSPCSCCGKQRIKQKNINEIYIKDFADLFLCPYELWCSYISNNEESDDPKIKGRVEKFKAKKKEYDSKLNFSRGINLICKCPKCSLKIFNLPINLELNKEYESPFKEFGLKCPFCNIELDTKDIISIGFYKCNALYNNHVFSWNTGNNDANQISFKDISIPRICLILNTIYDD